MVGVPEEDPAPLADFLLLVLRTMNSMGSRRLVVVLALPVPSILTNSYSVFSRIGCLLSGRTTLAFATLSK